MIEKVKLDTAFAMADTINKNGVAWSAISGKPSFYTPSSHTHGKADITNFAHIHTKSDITDFPTGYTGALTVVTGVNFGASSVTTSTITVSNGIITNIS